MITPYYYRINQVDKALINAKERGVDVQIITSRKRDIPAYMPFKNYLLFQKFLRKGIDVYQVQDRYLHMKGCQFDDESITFGSFNFDKWSWCNNNELNFYAEDLKSNKIFGEIFDQVKCDSVKVTSNREIPVKVMTWCRMWFWDNFLGFANFTANYRRYFKTQRKNSETGLFRKYFINLEDPKDQKVDEKLHQPYKWLYYDWDDTLGLDV